MKKQLKAQTSQGSLRVTITTERNYFSVTGEIGSISNPHTCGCIHEEILTHFPKLRPLVDLHLSDLDGVPMHAESNGWYWLAKSIGISEKYEPDQSPKECERIFAKHIRDATFPIMERVRDASDPRAEWSTAMEEMKPRWKAEAEAGLALIKSLLTINHKRKAS